MNFLYPAFLFALSAVVIPVIVHLFNFRKYKKVYFSNVQFLKEVELKTSSGRKLKNLLILASRILAITFLVLAFAKPYYNRNAKAESLTNSALSVYVDNSYSMETLNKEGALLEEAKRRAGEIVKAYGVNDKFNLITNDLEGSHHRMLTSEEFLDEVEKIRTSSAVADLNAVLKRQLELLKKYPSSKKTVYLISDFQANMGKSAVSGVDSTVNLSLVRVKANELPNISIDSVWFISPTYREFETQKLVVKLKNNSDKSAENIPIRLTVNKQQRAFAGASIPARKTTNDTLSVSGLRSGWQEAEVYINDNPVTFDDNFYLSFYVRPSMDVLAINEQNANPFIAAVYGADKFFKLENTGAGNVDYAGLAAYPLVIAVNLETVPSGLADQLAAYVKSGGNLFIFPSLSADINSFKSFLRKLQADIPIQQVNSESKVTSINLSHPVFTDVFEMLPKNPDLPAAKKYWQFETLSRTSRQSLLSFNNSRFFLSSYKTGKGRVYLSAVPVDTAASNLPQHAIFVPLMYKVALLSLDAGKLFYILGKDDVLELNKITLSANQTLSLRKDKFETIPEIRQSESKTRLFVADQINDAGIYRLFKGDSLLSAVAFNSNRNESDLSYLDDKALKKIFLGRQIEVFSPGREPVTREIKASGTGVQLWKLCLILALLSIAAEILLIRFYNTSKKDLYTVS